MRQGIVHMGRALLGAGNGQAQAGQLPGLRGPHDARQESGRAHQQRGPIRLDERGQRGAVIGVDVIHGTQTAQQRQQNVDGQPEGMEGRQDAQESLVGAKRNDRERVADVGQQIALSQGNRFGHALGAAGEQHSGHFGRPRLCQHADQSAPRAQRRQFGRLAPGAGLADL